MKPSPSRSGFQGWLLFFCLWTLPTAGSAAGKEAWVEVRSPHFVAYSDAGEAEARTLLRQFEEIRNVFRQVFPTIRVDPPSPTILLVTRDEISMKRFLPKSFEGKNPKRESGVFYSGPERNYALLRLDASAQFDKPYHVLFHEYTHGIIHLNFTGVPTWLDEGIADFYGTTEIQKDRVLLGSISQDALRTLRDRQFLSLETLLAVDHDSPHYRDGTKTGLFYSQSALMVHYLFMDEQAQKAGLLAKYFTALEKHSDPVAAGREGFGDLGKLLGNLVSYSRQPSFRFWNYQLSARLSDKDFQVKALQPAQALVLRAEFLQLSNQEPASRALLEEALALNPALPEVHAALGAGHILRGEIPQALAAFAEAARRGSTDFRTYYQLARLGREGTTGPDPKILEYLVTARRLHPDFPPIHSLLGLEHAKDPAQAGLALQEMKQAIRLDPGNLSYLANLGSLYLHLKQEVEARAVQDSLQTRARSPGEREIARQYGEHLRQYFAWKQADTSRESIPAAPKATTASPSKALSFHLSSYLVPLGREVLRLAQQGKVDEAIRKVEAARAQTKVPFDRKSLQDLLDQLKALPAAKPK